MNPEDEMLEQLKKAGVDIVCSLPCDRVKTLHELITREFMHVPLTREEEGVGIAAGAALAGRKPAMLFQSSGLGNMVNALSSLTAFYGFGLFLMISWRGVYKEAIAAQEPMGALTPELLKTLGIEFVEIREKADIAKIGEVASTAFDENRISAVLLNPKIWEERSIEPPKWENKERRHLSRSVESGEHLAKHTRYEVLKGITPSLKNKVVICNLGIPGKELYSVLHQPSNFYMMGSMGMATPLGLGVSLGTTKEVIVIDGDGSLLMNTGVLATVAETGAKNLTIIAIDNGVHGSTGNQPTAANKTAHLGIVAAGMGIDNTRSVTTIEAAGNVINEGSGPRFVHVIAKPGNAPVPNIPLTPHEIKTNVMEFLNR